MPSKYPPAFGIDFHVDDSEGVKIEGEEHGFRVVIVRPDDEHWARVVLDAVVQDNSANPNDVKKVAHVTVNPP